MSDQPTVEISRPGEPPPPPNHRRGRVVALIAGVTALVLAAALSLYFGLRPDSQPAASTNPSTSPSSSTSAPSVVLPSQSPSIGAGPSTGPAAPKTSAHPAAPDGRIPFSELKNATLDIPPWPADNLTGLSGPVKFANGQVTVPADGTFGFERYMIVSERVGYGDVDRDGATETVALIGAVVQGGGAQLIAFDRNASGRIVTMGTVVAATGPIRAIDDTSLQVRSNGTISVRLGDFQRCCGDETPQLWQVRSYSWNGHRFLQTGGPTSFPVNPAVTETGFSLGGDLVLGPAANGTRHGTLTLTITHAWGAAPAHLTVVFGTPSWLRPEGSGWPPVYTPPNYGTIAFDVPSPALGAKKTYTLAFSAPANASSAEAAVYLHGSNAKNGLLSEADPWNNTIRFDVRTVN